MCQVLHSIRVNICAVRRAGAGFQIRKQDLQSSLAGFIQVIWGSMEAISLASQSESRLTKLTMAPVLVIMPGEKSSYRSGRKKLVWCFTIFLLKHLMCLRF